MTSNTKFNRFYVSDSHFGHANIIKYCSRPYDDTDQMDADMISRWNAVVGVDDEVWHLGDVAMSYDVAKRIVPLLNGRKYLILGNHDKNRKQMIEAGFIDAYQSWKLKIGVKTVTLIHRPKPLTGYDAGKWLLHGHTHNSTPKVDTENKWINMSVEHWGYAPVPESEIAKIIR